MIRAQISIILARPPGIEQEGNFIDPLLDCLEEVA
jgi:hypothetical protein